MFSKSSLMTLMQSQGRELLVYTLCSALTCFGVVCVCPSPQMPCDFLIGQRPCLDSSSPIFLLLYFLSLCDMSGFYGLYLLNLLQDTFIPQMQTLQALVSTVWWAIDWARSESPVTFKCITYAWWTGEGHRRGVSLSEGPTHLLGERSLFFRSRESKIHRTKHLRQNIQNHH